MDKISEQLGVDLWEQGDHTLWTADLYPEKNTMKEAVKAALDLYELILGDLDPADVSYEAKRVNWKNAARKSLCSGFHAADADAIIARDRRMQELVQMD